eukprot:CAMPEP_0113583450 /NCGR_PEP_ID=MMETSP0015_2-20120614/32523_1 /TAXON_ID=2838 /ORGANISM="Odontella" /LENGTH=96 /DNA_ID=CAMNT_0000488327 /DNA_START=544 /DNA_END=830 /DNA_ORIENTATION=- /assembly_acc=CAM_ASM_000160
MGLTALFSFTFLGCGATGRELVKIYKTYDMNHDQHKADKSGKRKAISQINHPAGLEGSGGRRDSHHQEGLRNAHAGPSGPFKVFHETEFFAPPFYP